MVATPSDPSQILNSYRKSDAVIIVCQNNIKKMVEIAALNEEAARVLGYTNEELLGKPLSLVLPERVSSTIDEFVEFEENQNDLFFVLSKIRNFAVKTRSGHDLQFKLRIIHGESIDNNPWFHLVLQDEEKLRKNNAFRTVLMENFKGHEVLDKRTGFPDRASLLKDLEMVVYHVRAKEISASLAVIDINAYKDISEKYGDEICDKLHQHIGQVCKMKLRAEDTIGSLSERSLGIILIDAKQEPAHMVLNRLRWTIGVSPLQITERKEITAQANIGFVQIDGKINHTDIIQSCEKFMEELAHTATNSLNLVVTHERRESEDRRVKNVPVPTERRKKSRRKKSMGPKRPVH
jgi:diguanylate cyclase (GGDEF)-like protein